MEEIPADVRSFIQDHPFLQLTDAKKVKCTLNGHEFPCNLKELQDFTSGKKYLKLSAVAQFNYSQYEPHVVPSTKQPNHLFCKLTLRHINRLPHHVLRHINGKRYQRALQKYEECVREGVAFVPASLRQKKPRHTGEEERGRHSKRGNGFWEPSSSGGEGEDSEDSMSDLYPSTIFTSKKPEGGEGEIAEVEGSDSFQTDSDDEEASPMEVDKQAPQKRRKAQTAAFKKKFKSHNKKKKWFKKGGTVKNGK
ncbi:surfeit locus protein 2 [Anguilla rostrata]|uniref:surfeit locus protein 2 n=1 Tax=Anguilla rostrata TaxID=7938 RepID=UPI0030CFEF06